jgi:hypothetical protein
MRGLRSRSQTKEDYCITSDGGRRGEEELEGREVPPFPPGVPAYHAKPGSPSQTRRKRLKAAQNTRPASHNSDFGSIALCLVVPLEQSYHGKSDGTVAAIRYFLLITSSINHYVLVLILFFVIN